jgi:hypothetical protein
LHDDLAKALIRVGTSTVQDGRDAGETMLNAEWPHAVTLRTRRSVTPRQRLEVFKADGFRCRYSGDLLLFPAYLRALSALWPAAFPYHPNGKSDVTHPAYWSHTASLEHVAPVAIGGAESEDNWITTSNARNMVRSRYSLESLRWTVGPREPRADWDGGLQAFHNLLDAHPELFGDATHGQHLKRWKKIASAI